ncbi:pancreatic lipase-related protein 2-like [Crassostrea angulata]|uniref:pancreatic lipase-related protein 2-like n=1 Tax=Magallana angulata TaxID=2784310 RepID=UPI0022B0A4F7|nr:pancreatic lipase-related protein 2-like [Crassostrea angulata]
MVNNMTSQIAILLTFVAGICTTSTTENPYENRTVCYKYVGCFNNLPPFDNAAYDLPRSPEEIGTEFLLFTRRNPSNPDRLDYVSQSSVLSSQFQSSVQTKIIIHGFANTVKTTWLYNMKDAFLTKGDYNVIVVAWGAGAAAPDYNQAVSNTRMVATQTRLIIEGLVQAGGRLTDIHLIGHSLGAHTAGSTGRQMGGKVGRITGLDPAEPEFENHPEGVRIDPSDAVFVDIIHTNGAPIRRGGAGLMQASGHVDFYVNGGERQPGCPNLVTGTFEQLFSQNVSGAVLAASCSHGRSHEYFTESILTDCPFTAYPCDNYVKFSSGGCSTCGLAGCSQLGLNADVNSGRGKLFLDTLSMAPFCGYHYLVTVVIGTHDAIGQLLLTVRGNAGQTQLIPVTGSGESLRAGMPHSKVVVLERKFTDINAVDVLYKKKRGFLFGWGGAPNDISLTSVTIKEIWANNKFTFCMGSFRFSDGVSVTTTQRSATGTC